MNERIISESNVKISQFGDKLKLSQKNLKNLNNKVNYVTYEDFGAVGKDFIDDYNAIYQAHKYANENNIPVKADGSKTYYIENVLAPIPISTNVDWNGCSIIINENNNPEVIDVFKVISNHNPISISDEDLVGITINRSTKNIPKLAGHGCCLVDVINTNKKQFIRKGSNADTGYSQTDQFLIDNLGNVCNDIIWDFDEISSITLYRVDSNILTISNANFISIENNIVGSTYLRKGILVNRSNVVVSNISHQVSENTVQNSPNRGIVYFNTCANVVFRDSRVCSRLAYNNVGTYDLSLYKVVDVLIENVIDTNFMDSNRWGCIASNYAKDVIYKNCRLSRIDAHRGVWNLTIRDTEVGQQGLRLIGGGNLIIDNFTSYSGTLIAFRSDYGSTWNGRVRIKNVKHKPKNIGTDMVKVISFDNDMTHDFGYQCYHTLGIQMENYYLYNYNDNGNNGIFDLITVSASDFYNAVEEFRVRFPYELSFKNIKTNSGGFRLIDCYLHGFRVGTSFSYEVGDESYNTTSRSLNLKNNVSITLDDIELSNVATTNNTIVLRGLGRQTDDTYTDTNKRVLPRIILKSCSNVINNLMGLPFILQCYDCDFKYNNAVASGSRNISTFIGCNFEPTPLNTDDLVFRFNGVTTTFVNCYFKKPVYSSGSISSDTILNCYNFLSYSNVGSGDSSFRSICSFIGCRIDSSINPLTLFTNLNSFNYDFNSSYGDKKK